MTIYTHFSDSHKEMYERYFIQSLRKLYTKDEVKVVAAYHPQTTQSGSFMTPGWLDSMDIKLRLISEALEQESQFIFADCDIQFFRSFVSDIVEQLKSVDMVFQEDRESLCAGFFGCNSNERTKQLFTSIHTHFRSLVNDQVALNNFKDTITYKLLDKEQYYTIGNFFENKNDTFVWNNLTYIIPSNIWDNTTNIIPPKNIVMHHANYVIGTENKLKLLEMIKTNTD